MYPGNHAKGSVYEGGVAVPLIVAGAGVTRAGERESSLVSSVDLFATIANIAGTGTEEFNDSINFSGLFSEPSTSRREYSYAEVNNGGGGGWAIRNDRYKLVQRIGALQELYDLESDSLELDNLLDNGIDFAVIIAELQAQANLIRQ